MILEQAHINMAVNTVSGKGKIVAINGDIVSVQVLGNIQRFKVDEISHAKSQSKADLGSHVMPNVE